jgi:biopolymer transport protein ExbB/TolQ/DNA-directed RNA polymerase subunit RPC12/RpoP
MPSTIEFPCPKCERKIRAQAKHIGQKGKCPNCGYKVIIQGPSEEVDLAPVDEMTTSMATTDVSGPLSAVIGAAVTGVLYAFVFLAIANTYVGELFIDRGPIPFVITFVTSWGLSILALKYIAVRRQLSYAGLELDFIPLETGMQITGENTDKFVRHLEELPKKMRESIIGRRIHGALDHFRARTRVPEVQAYLGSRAELDASSVDSGYTLLRAFIWAVPILGFIGTVMGISGAVSKLAEQLDTAGPAQVAAAEPADVAADPEEGADASMGSKMIAAMGGVTQGLAVAFDTTFLALIMAIILLFPTEALRKTEYGMLDRIEAFTNGSLLRRMSDDTEAGPLPPEVARALEPAFQEHQRWLVKWQKQVGALGDVIGQAFDDRVMQVEQRFESMGASRIEEMQQIVTALSDASHEITEAMNGCALATQQTAENLRSTTESVGAVQDRLDGDSPHVVALTSETPQPVAGSSGVLEKSLETLNENLSRLNELVSNGQTVKDGDGQAVVQRKGLFGFLKSS